MTTANDLVQLANSPSELSLVEAVRQLQKLAQFRPLDADSLAGEGKDYYLQSVNLQGMIPENLLPEKLELLIEETSPENWAVRLGPLKVLIGKSFTTSDAATFIPFDEPFTTVFGVFTQPTSYWVRSWFVSSISSTGFTIDRHSESDGTTLFNYLAIGI